MSSDNKLKNIIEKIERLEAEVATIREDVNAVYHEAKNEGYDSKVIRKIVSDRRKDPRELNEFDQLYETYKAALV